MPDSDIEVKFSEHGKTVICDIIMTSILVSDEDEKRVFDRYYRSPIAMELTKNGKGIGLYLAKKFFELNNIKFMLKRIPNSRIITVGQLKYSKNMFVIELHEVIK